MNSWLIDAENSQLAQFFGVPLYQHSSKILIAPDNFRVRCSIEIRLKTADKIGQMVFVDTNDNGSFLYSGKW